MLLCVDREGRRVQRLPGLQQPAALGGFDALYRRDAAAALELAHEHAADGQRIRRPECLSFAPVVVRRAATLGNRAGLAGSAVVAAFTRAYVTACTLPDGRQLSISPDTVRCRKTPTMKRR
jgi:hypothetical protein